MGKMKRYVAVVMTAALSVLLMTTTTSGAVEDKRAPGDPGHKMFQILVDDAWRLVPEDVWNRCDMEDSFPLCVFLGN
jgi:hypothetical protein